MTLYSVVVHVGGHLTDSDERREEKVVEEKKNLDDPIKKDVSVSIHTEGIPRKDTPILFFFSLLDGSRQRPCFTQ